MPRAVRSGGAVTADKTAVTVSADLLLEILLLVRDIRTAMTTKNDMRAAVRTILRGEDVTSSKPRHRKNPAKRQQLKAALEYKNSHAGCTLHNACARSFVSIAGGYSSAKSLYRIMLRHSESSSPFVA